MSRIWAQLAGVAAICGKHENSTVFITMFMHSLSGPFRNEKSHRTGGLMFLGSEEEIQK